MVYFARLVLRVAESTGCVDAETTVDCVVVCGTLSTVDARGLAGVALGPVGGATAVESARAGAGRRPDEKSIGVPTITTAMSTNANRVRLSMQRRDVAKGLDHSRPAETDCIVRFDGSLASLRESRHTAPVLRSHTRSSLDNSGTRAGGAARASLGTRERIARGVFAQVKPTWLTVSE